MSLSYTYGGAPLVASIAPSSLSLISIAKDGEVAFGGLTIDDIGSSELLVGHRAFTVEESACSQPRLFTGWTTERGLARSEDRGMLVGTDRIHDVTLVDLNALFGFRVIKGSGGNRAEETWNDRLAWIVGSDFLVGLIADTGFVTYDSTHLMDAADYRGSYPGDVFADLLERGPEKRTYFAFWDPVADAVSLYMGAIAAGTGESSLYISNDPADIDGETVFPPFTETVLTRKPDQVYSEVVVSYRHGRVYRRRPSTEVAYVRRGTTINRPYVGLASTAASQAEAWLTRHSIEVDTIVTTIRVPAAKAGWVTAGQTINCKFTHLPGYTAWTSLRVMQSQPTPVDDVGAIYDIHLELEYPTEGTGPGGECVDDIIVVQSKAAEGTQPYSVALDAAPTVGNVLVALVAVESEGWITTSISPGLWNEETRDEWGPAPELVLLSFSNIVMLDDPATYTIGGSSVPSRTCIIEVSGITDHFHFDAAGDNGIASPFSIDVTPTADIAALLLGSTIYEPNSTTAAPASGIIELDDGPLGATRRAWAGYKIVPVTAGTYAIGGTAAGLTHWWMNGLVFRCGTPDSIIDAGPVPGQPADNLTATTDPTVNDDATAGYSVGSRWINTTTGISFVLVDSTAGAAVWVSTTTSTGRSFAYFMGG